jgi:hypothetical protein
MFRWLDLSVLTASLAPSRPLYQQGPRRRRWYERAAQKL